MPKVFVVNVFRPPTLDGDVRTYHLDMFHGRATRGGEDLYCNEPYKFGDTPHQAM